MANIAAIAIQIQANTAPFERGLGQAQAGLQGLAAASGAAMGGVSQAVAQGLGSAQAAAGSVQAAMNQAAAAAPKALALIDRSGAQAAQRFASHMAGFSGTLGQTTRRVEAAVQPGLFQRLLAPINAVRSAVDRWTDLPGVRQLKAGISVVNESFDAFLSKRYGALAKPIKFAGMGLDVAAMSQGMVIPGISILGSLGAAAVVEAGTVGVKVGRSLTQSLLASAARIPGALAGLFRSLLPASAATGTLGAAATTTAARTTMLATSAAAAAAATGSMAAGAAAATAAVAGLGAVAAGAGGSVSSFGGILKGALVGTGVGALISTLTSLAKKIFDVRGTLEGMHQAANVAGTLGISTRALGSLRRVAQEVMVPVETLDAGLDRLQRVIGEAGNPTTEMAAAFRVLGLDARQLAAIPLDQALGRVADQINALPDPASRAAAVVSLFGRSGQGLLDVLARGSAGFAAMQAQMSSLGSSDAGNNPERVTIAFIALEKAFGAIGKAIATAVAPVLADVVTMVADIVVGIGRFIGSLKNVLQGLGMLAGGIAIFHGIRLGVLGVVAGFKALTAAMMANPIIAIAAVVLAVISAFVDWGEVLGGIGKVFKAAVSLVLDGVALILDALALLPRWLGGGHFQRWANGVRNAARDVMSDVAGATGAANAATAATAATNIQNAGDIFHAQAIAQARPDQLAFMGATGGVSVPINVDTSTFERALAAAGQFRDRFLAQIVAPVGLAAARLQQSIDQASAGIDFEIAARGMNEAQRQLLQFRMQGATASQLAGLAQRQQVVEAQRLADEVGNVQRRMMDEAATLGMTTRQAEIYRLERRGVSEELLEELRLTDMMLAGMEEQNRLQQEANRLREASLSPLDTFRNGLNELQQMMQLGIDLEPAAAAREVDRLMNQLEGTMQRAETRAPSGLQRGSREALSAINQARIESGRGEESQTERLQRVLDEQKAIQARQEQRLSEIRDALESGEIFGLADL